jgi:hypothetical protein
MRSLKRAVWFCFAGCCCAGLVLIGGEQSRSTNDNARGRSAYGIGAICPYIFYGQNAGLYYYECIVGTTDCNPATYCQVWDTRPHQLGDCGSCPDPITPATEPVAIDPAELSLVPEPDPLFSGVLR